MCGLSGRPGCASPGRAGRHHHYHRGQGTQTCACVIVGIFFWSLHVLNVVECGFHVLLQHSVPFLLSAELIWNHTKYTRAIAFAIHGDISLQQSVLLELYNQLAV